MCLSEMKMQDLKEFHDNFINALIKFPTSRKYLEAYFTVEHQYSEWLEIPFSIPHTTLNKLVSQKCVKAAENIIASQQVTKT